MKKRVVCLLLVVLLLSGVHGVFASFLMNTNRDIDVFTFVELSIVRMLEAEKSSGVKLVNITDRFTANNPLLGSAKDGDVTVPCTIGDITYSTDSFLVNKYSNILMNLSRDDEYNAKSIYRAIAAMSVLEYGEVQDSLLKLDEKKSAYQKMENIFFGQIAPRFDSTNFWFKLKSVNNIEIYSGNFTYTLSYHEVEIPDDKKQEIVFIEAIKTREN